MQIEQVMLEVGDFQHGVSMMVTDEMIRMAERMLHPDDGVQPWCDQRTIEERKEQKLCRRAELGESRRKLFRLGNARREKTTRAQAEIELERIYQMAVG